MKMRITQQESYQIFKSIDDDCSGTIELSELKHDFNRCVSSKLEDLIDDENRLNVGDNENFGAMGGRFAAGNAGASDGNSLIDLKTKC